VKDAQGGPAYGRTNWRRFAVAVGLPAVVAGGLIAATATGALAASFTISGKTFKLSADHLHGDGFTQYSGPLATKDGATIAAMSGMKYAELTKMCQTVAAPTPLGPVVMRIDAGGGTEKVIADNLLIGMNDLQGEATFTDIKIGLDASTLSGDGSQTHGEAGGFGQQASKVDIDNLRQTAYYTSAGTFRLNGMKLHLYLGKEDTAGKECF